VSISFTVGGYRCGIDGQDMLAGWFGDPEPAGMWDDKATCMHFPGIDYGKEGVGFAVMENNRALEESMVYMNSSPSAMLMRKARAMAERGVLTPVQRVIVEQKFRTVLPMFGRRVWTIAPREPSKEVVMATRTIAVGDKVRWTESEKEREGTVHAIDDEGRLTITTIDDEGAIRDVEVDGVDALDPEEAEEAEMTGHEAAAGAEARAAAPSTAADLTAHLTGKEPAGHAADVPDGTALPELVSLHGVAGRHARYALLDARAAAPKRGGECLERHLERLRPESPNAFGKLLAHLEAAELPAIVVKQHAAVQRQDGMGVLARFGIPQEPAGHSQMDDQVAAAIERDQNELPVTPHRADSPAFDFGRQPVRVRAPQHARAPEFRLQDTPARERREGPHYSLNFRKLRHSVPVSAMASRIVKGKRP